MNMLNPKRAENLVFIHTNICLLSIKRNSTNTYNEEATKMWDIDINE
jgi:hypothetical protein